MTEDEILSRAAFDVTPEQVLMLQARVAELRSENSLLVSAATEAVEARDAYLSKGGFMGTEVEFHRAMIRLAQALPPKTRGEK